MARRLVRARVGSGRITSNVGEAEAAYTRSIRSQMEQIERNITDFIQEVTDQTSDILLEALQPTFDKSQQYVPLLTGRLKESGYLEGTKTASGGTVTIGYGKAGDPGYAVFVHEMTGYYHKPPTRAKFLQAALEEDMEAIQDRIIKAYASMTGD